MKIKHLLLLGMVCFSFVISAQQEQTRSERHAAIMEKFKQFKRDFYIKEVGLNTIEAEKFFAIQDEFDKQRFELHRQEREVLKKFQGNKDLIEQDYKQAADAINAKMLKEAQLMDEYFQKYKTILSAKKLFLMKRADSKFTEELLRDRDSRRQGPPPGKNNKK